MLNKKTRGNFFRDLQRFFSDLLKIFNKQEQPILLTITIRVRCTPSASFPVFPFRNLAGVQNAWTEPS